MIATLTTCNNEKHLPIYTIEGKLYWDCERTQPMKNITLSVTQIGTSNRNRPMQTITLGEATTNEEGYFRLDYKITDKYRDASYELIASGLNLYKVLKTSKEIIEHKSDLFVDNKVNLNVSMKKGQKTYTEKDTLYWSVLRNTPNGVELVMSPKIVINLQSLETVNLSIQDLDITKFCENEGRFLYGVGLQNFAYYYTQRLGEDSPLIQFNDCNKNQQLVIDLP